MTRVGINSLFFSPIVQISIWCKFFWFVLIGSCC
jgi:hypothetical protein